MMLRSTAPYQSLNDNSSSSSTATSSQPLQENIGILPPNIRDREELASAVNNYLSTHHTTTEPSNAEKKWDAADYFFAALTFACCFNCRTYENNPTEVSFVQNFYGHVMADAAAVGAYPSWGKKHLGKLNFQDLTETNNHGSFGNVHFVYVPQSQFAKITIDGQPKLLDAGYHLYIASQFQNQGLTKTNAEIIQHGNTTVFNVPPGRVYIVNDPTKADISQQIEILKQGHHVRTSKNMKHVKLSTGLQLYPVNEDIMTLDNYKISIKANATLAIEEVDRLVSKLGFSENLSDVVNAIIFNQVKSAFQEAGQQSSYRSQVEYALGQSQNPGAYDSDNSNVYVTSSSSTSMTKQFSAAQQASISIEVGIHDKVKEKLDELESIGIHCASVQFNSLMPDESTVKMLEHANQRAIDQKTQLSAAHFESQQVGINTKAQTNAKLQIATADAEAMRIRAKGLADASKISALSNELEITNAVGTALSRVSANVSFYSSDVAGFALFRNGFSTPNAKQPLLENDTLPTPSAPASQTM